jgi:hypothetical protein
MKCTVGALAAVMRGLALAASAPSARRRRSPSGTKRGTAGSRHREYEVVVPLMVQAGPTTVSHPSPATQQSGKVRWRWTA